MSHNQKLHETSLQGQPDAAWDVEEQGLKNINRYNLLLNKCSHLEEEVDCHPLVISVVDVSVSKMAACVRKLLALSDL